MTSTARGRCLSSAARRGAARKRAGAVRGSGATQSTAKQCAPSLPKEGSKKVVAAASFDQGTLDCVPIALFDAWTLTLGHAC